MKRLGRKPNSYQTSWGETIEGFSRCSDGRWRISATDQRFSEQDEHVAVARFRSWQRSQSIGSVTITVPRTSFATEEAFQAALRVGGVELCQAPDSEASLQAKLPEAVLWPWFKEQLLTQPALVAKMVGIPQLAGLVAFDIPKPPIPIRTIRRCYLEHSTASTKSKREALASFDSLVRFCTAGTLDDLTDDKLLAFRKKVVSTSSLKSSGTILAYFGRIRNVIRVAGRACDTSQIDTAVARCSAKLYAVPNSTERDPKPISRANFQKLLAGVDQTAIPHVWRTMLLMGLNCLLYMEDLCDLKWADIDLENGTFDSRRKKRGRVRRVAMLWPETVDALGAIPRRGQSPFVFVSAIGTRYNKSTKINDFKDFREKVGVDGVTFSHLRDGGYTAAVTAKVMLQHTKLLAGHSLGMTDHYAARQPLMTAEAVEAIHAAYLG